MHTSGQRGGEEGAGGGGGGGGGVGTSKPRSTTDRYVANSLQKWNAIERIHIVVSTDNTCMSSLS